MSRTGHAPGSLVVLQRHTVQLWTVQHRLQCRLEKQQLRSVNSVHSLINLSLLNRVALCHLICNLLRSVHGNSGKAEKVMELGGDGGNEENLQEFIKCSGLSRCLEGVLRE